MGRAFSPLCVFAVVPDLPPRLVWGAPSALFRARRSRSDGDGEQATTTAVGFPPQRAKCGSPGTPIRRCPPIARDKGAMNGAPASEVKKQNGMKRGDRSRSERSVLRGGIVDGSMRWRPPGVRALLPPGWMNRAGPSSRPHEGAPLRMGIVVRGSVAGLKACPSGSGGRVGLFGREQTTTTAVGFPPRWRGRTWMAEVTPFRFRRRGVGCFKENKQRLRRSGSPMPTHREE
jgi:hypothetical protein